MQVKPALHHKQTAVSWHALLLTLFGRCHTHAFALLLSAGADTGMPLISDPGSGLVAAAAAAGHRVIPIAGPSAFLLALVASGLSSTRFMFVGFLPDKAKRRQQQLQDLAGVDTFP